MKYSVLIPVYNVEAYLDECIASVLRQTYHNYEIVLVDDGSVDGSPNICDRFSSRYPDQVKVIHKKNEGVLLARNEAIRQATGDVVLFLDADDCLRKDALMRIHETFEKYRCDMVIYNHSTTPDFDKACAVVPFAADTCMEAEEKKQLYRLLCDVSYLNGLCFKAVRKEIADLLLQHAQWHQVTNGEDLLCTLPLVTRAEKIVYLDQVLYYYRKRPGSVVHTFHFKRLQSIKTVHQEFERYIDIWQMPELHPRHYAREVRSWIEAMRLMIENRSAIGADAMQSGLKAMAEDAYFRNACEKMDVSQLSPYNRLLAVCLYKRKYSAVYWLCEAVSRTRAVRRLIDNEKRE